MRYHINNPRLKERQNKLNERRDLKWKKNCRRHCSSSPTELLIELRG